MRNDENVISIAGEGFVAEAAPVFGGALLSFRDRHGPLLRASSLAEAATDPRNAACFPCVPWFGRLYDGLPDPGGRADLKPTLAACDPEHPLHGDGWVGAWETLSHSDDRLLLRFEGGPAAASGFPYPYEATQAFSLSRAGLMIILTLRNIGDAPMPAGLGLHPYFQRTPATRVAFKAQKKWTPPGVGPGRLEAIANGLGAASRAHLPEATVDHSFAGFSGEAEISGEGPPIRLRSTAPILHLYTPSGVPYFCFEPVTHLPGELTRRASGFGGVMLAPGASLGLEMAIGR